MKSLNVYKVDLKPFPIHLVSKKIQAALSPTNKITRTRLTAVGSMNIPSIGGITGKFLPLENHSFGDRRIPLTKARVIAALVSRARKLKESD